MMKFVSLDPGITTGLSLAILEGNVLYIACEQEKFSHRNLYDFLTDINPDAVVCESFEYRNNQHRDRLELYPVELIGVTKLFWTPYMQTASKGKGYYRDDKLKKMGLYIPGRDHGRDAMRHLLHWFTFGAGYQHNKRGTKISLAQFETLLTKREM